MLGLKENFIVVSIVQSMEGNNIALLEFNDEFKVINEIEITSEEMMLYSRTEFSKIIKNYIIDKWLIYWENNENLNIDGIGLKEYLKKFNINYKLESDSAILQCREMYLILKDFKNVRIKLWAN